MILNYIYGVPNYNVGPNYPIVSQVLPGVKASPEAVNENQSS